MRIVLIPPGSITASLPVVLDYLRVSAQWTGGRADVDDLARFLLNGQMQLWAVVNDNGVFGHLMTEFKQYPRLKILAVQYCAADPHSMDRVEAAAFGTLEQFAKDAGCAGVEFVGRPGWKKSALKHGYETRSVTYQKMFKE